MEERKVEKASVIIIWAVVSILVCVNVDYYDIGIYSEGPLTGRFLYPFFHANFFHSTLNMWCMTSLVFTYEITMRRILLAYIVAVSVPLSWFPCSNNIPTIGMSGVIYFLFSSISFEVKRKLYYQSWMAFYLIIGFFFPNTNAWIHLYCYLLGLIWALLNKPIIRNR